MNVWTVQLNPRDHNGEIILVTTNEDHAFAVAASKLAALNINEGSREFEPRTTELVEENRRKMSDREFVEWGCTPWLDWVIVEEHEVTT